MAGRKNAYDDKIKPNLEKIRHWLSEGYSHQQIYEMIGVKKTSFYKYQNPSNKKFYKTEFANILKTSKEVLQIKLEDALYKEAMGYEYEETHVEIEDHTTLQGNTRTRKKQKKIKKYARPNSNLLIFVLCNKWPEKWRRIDKDIVEALETGNVNLNITDKHIKSAFKALYPGMDEKQLKEVEQMESNNNEGLEDDKKNKNKKNKDKTKKK
jgi:hypothetical protein